MKTRTLVAALVVAGAVGVGGFAYAQNEEQPQKSTPAEAGAGASLREPGGAFAVMATGSAKVKSIDKDKRTITLESPDGQTATYKCGKNMVNFDQIKEGDEVKATMIDRVAVSVGAGGAPGAAEGGMVALAPKGTRPGVIIADTDVMRDKVASVDAQARTISLEGTSGKPQTIKVGSGVDLNNVKKGDDVTVRYTQGLALVDMKGAGEAQPAGAEIRPGEGAGDIDAMTASATVESVDPAERTVTLKGEQGKERTIHLGKEVRNFDQIQPGDKVKATLTEETAVDVTKGGAAAGATEGALMARTPEGAKPGMLIAQTDMVTGKIDSVDADKHMLTLTEPDGKQKVLKVSPKVDLSQLKAGDDVNARVTRALGIIVEKP